MSDHAVMTLDHEQRLRFLESLERHLIAYGSCWGNEIAWTQAGAVQNTWYTIADTDMSDGRLINVAHDGSGKLTVTYPGDYQIVYAVSIECSANNQHIQSAISISGTKQNDGRDHGLSSVANDHFHLGSAAILSLTAGQYIEVSVRTTSAGGPTLTVDHLNIVVVRTGSTG